MSNTRLILGHLPSNFDPICDRILGSWSLLENENVEINLPSDPLVSEDEYQTANKEVAQLFDKLFPVFIEILNKVNAVNYDHRFWEIMLRPWLTRIIELYVERKIRLDHFFINQNEAWSVDLLEINHIEFKDTYDFLVNGLESTEFNHWMMSQIVKNKYPEYRGKALTIKELKKQSYVYDRSSLKFKLKFLLKTTLGVISVYGMTLFESIFLSLRIKKSLKNAQASKTSIAKKQELNEEEKWLYNLLKDIVPRCFLELEGLLRFTFNIPYKYRIISGSLLYTEEEYKYFLARYQMSGGQIIPVQHGSNYGALMSFCWNDLNELKFRHFITWGWDKYIAHKRKLIPLPSPIISKLERKQSNGKIILVGTQMTPMQNLLSSILHSNQILKYRGDKCVFLRGLDSQKRSLLYYRPYFNSRGVFKDSEFVKKQFPYLNILEGNLSPETESATLVIVDHPGTTFHMTIGANIPTVAFWDKNTWKFNLDFNEKIKPLYAVGILHETPTQAAEFINSLDCVETWWNETKVQEARKGWAKEYALASKQYIKKWNEVLKELNCS